MKTASPSEMTGVVFPLKPFVEDERTAFFTSKKQKRTGPFFDPALPFRTVPEKSVGFRDLRTVPARIAPDRFFRSITASLHHGQFRDVAVAVS